MPTLYKKIMLLNPPYQEPIIRDNYCCFTSKSGYLWPPVDLLYLSAVLNRPGIELSVIDAVAEHVSGEEVLTRVGHFRPQIIISLTGTVSYPEDLKLLKTVSQSSKSSLYLMGNTPCFRPDFFVKKYRFVSGVIHQFFDPGIADFFLSGKHSQSITYRKQNKIVRGAVNTFKPAAPLPRIGAPQYRLFPLNRYSTPFIKNKPLATALTSFGCPFNCQFCVGSALHYHPHDINDLKTEFDAMKQAGVKEIFFEDSTFNANTAYLRSICELLIEGRYGFTWSANIHSFNVSASILGIMKKAGCHTLQIGVESGNADILQKYAPTKKKEKIAQAFALCKKAGIRTLGYFIIGFPEEGRQEANNTIRFARQIKPDFASFSILTPDYGTKLHEQAVKNRNIRDIVMPFDSSGSPVLANTKLTPKEQSHILRDAYFQFYFTPGKIMQYITDVKSFPTYLKNGLLLVKHMLLP